MDTPGSRFAAALAERLARVVPPPASVRSEGGDVVVYERDEPWGGAGPFDEVLGWPDADEAGEPWPLAERVETAASATLSGLQDCVARVLRAEWPRLPGGGMALPGARCDGERLFMWFGPDEGSAALTLAPISLADILPGESPRAGPSGH